VVRGRGNHAGMRKRLPEPDAGVGEVDPERALRHRARAGGSSPVRRGGKPRAERERDDQKPPHRPAVKVAAREARLTHASRLTASAYASSSGESTSGTSSASVDSFG